jgi:hypothetical protein
MIRALILALALLAAPAIAQPVTPAVDEARRIAMLSALRAIGVEVGAVWPIGDAVYQIEEIRIERSRGAEVAITVRTRQLK